MSITEPPVRLTTWNCCTGPLPTKLAALARLRPDIAVVPECPRVPASAQAFWLGENPRKGLAILTRGAWRVSPVATRTALPRYVQPVRIEGPERFLLIAVWAMNIGADRYVRGLHRACDLLAPLLCRGPVVMMGDFNANAIWDREHPADRSYSALAERLGRLGLVSAYHARYAQAPGRESRATFYTYRHRHRPYHLDYCFVPAAWVPRLTSVRIGRHASWAGLSDHMPLSVTVAGSTTG